MNSSTIKLVPETGPKLARYIEGEVLSPTVELEHIVEVLRKLHTCCDTIYCITAMIINKKNGGELVSNLAREFDISRAAIYVWLKEATNKDAPTELHGETNFQKEYYKLLNEKKLWRTIWMH